MLARAASAEDAMEGAIVLLFLGLLYFLPTVIAASKGHHNTGAIFALNLLLGWTVLGWIAAFVWSLTNQPRYASGRP